MRSLAIGLWWLLIASNTYALNWSDFWFTKDQQGQALMKQKNYEEAKKTFQDPAWRGSAAYRAGDFKEALRDFSLSNTEENIYNQGNTQAMLGEYKQALESYNQVLIINPQNKDAEFNRQIILQLLKNKQTPQNNQSNKKNKPDQNQQGQNQQSQNQQSQNQQGQNQQSQNQQGQNQQSQNQQGQNQQDQNQQDQNQQDQNQQDQNQQDQNQQDQNQQDQNQQGQNQQGQNQQGQNQQGQNQQGQNQQGQNQQGQNQQGKNNAGQNQQESNSAEKQQPKSTNTQNTQEGKKSEQTQALNQAHITSEKNSEMNGAKEQWLKLIPDDPGGLLREKFLRDHIRRQRGWNP